MNDLLRALADADRAVEAPVRVEVAVRAEFRRQARRRRMKRRMALFAATGAMAAALMIVAGSRTETRPVTRPAPAPVVMAARQAPAIETARPVRHRKTRKTTAHPRLATDFVPLPYGDSLTPFEKSRLVRIRLPRQELEIAGFPPYPASAGDFIDADVLLGEDGLARAIRLIRE